MVRFTSCIIIFAIFSPLIIADDPCRYQDSTKGVIDLSSLSSTNGKAAFPDLIPSSASNYKYSYNPCKPFSEGSTCTNVAACQVASTGEYTFVLGTQNSAKWNPGAGIGDNLVVSYSYGSKNVQVELACAHNGSTSIEALGEGPSEVYKFRLTSKCSCWNGCKTSSGTSASSLYKGGFPAGAIFLIIIVVLAVIYLIVFAIYNRVRHQRTGVDLIAHRTFWVAVPVYAKDGVTYLFRRVTGKGGGEYRSV